MVPLLRNLHLHLLTTALEFCCCLWILLQGFPVLPPLTFLLIEGSHNGSDFPHHDTGKYRCNEHLSFQALLPDRYKKFRASYEQMQRAFWLTLSNSFFHLQIWIRHVAGHGCTRTGNSIHLLPACPPAIPRTVS